MSSKPVGNVRAAIESAWRRMTAVTPVKSALPGAPSGKLERWLVSHKGTNGVLGVVWHDYWFGARELAEGTHKEYRDRLYIELMPLFEDELAGAPRLSAAGIANRLGRLPHTEKVTNVDHETGVVTARTKSANGKAR